MSFLINGAYVTQVGQDIERCQQEMQGTAPFHWQMRLEILLEMLQQRSNQSKCGRNSNVCGFA